MGNFALFLLLLEDCECISRYIHSSATYTLVFIAPTGVKCDREGLFSKLEADQYVNSLIF